MRLLLFINFILLNIILISCGVLHIKNNNEQFIDDHHYHPDFNKDAKEWKPRNIDELESDYWIEQSIKKVNEQINKAPITKKAKNIILFIGDGLSTPTLAATRVYIGGEEKQLYMETFPYTGTVKTYCLNYQVPDSACTATAYLSGIKGNYGTIGLNGHVERGSCVGQLNKNNHATSLTKMALDAGKSAGLVTTTRVTHASPAGVYANSAERDWETDGPITLACKEGAAELSDIAKQLVYGNVGSQLKVILGGGRRSFLPNTTLDNESYLGDRQDNAHLINEWLAIDSNRKFVWNREELLNIVPESTDTLMGLFEGSHMKYHLQTKNDGSEDKEPTLSEMVDVAIDVLKKNENGFFLFVEGGKIDLAHHANQARIAIDETAEFSKAIELARKKLSEDDSLIVVSSDHSHVMSFSGYPDRGNDIFGMPSSSASDNKKYHTLAYANGPSFPSHMNLQGRVDPTTLSHQAYNYTFPAMVNLGSETHGGDDVAVFASGPWAHLFSGSYEQHAIPHFLAYAACIGDGKKAC